MGVFLPCRLIVVSDRRRGIKTGIKPYPRNDETPINIEVSSKIMADRTSASRLSDPVGHDCIIPSNS
jgi:hypothetical protein